MTHRDKVQPIIRDVLCAELGAAEDNLRSFTEPMSESLAQAIAAKLYESGLLKDNFPLGEVEARIKSAIITGDNWPTETSGVPLSIKDCATRIYSGLENAPTYFIGLST